MQRLQNKIKRATKKTRVIKSKRRYKKRQPKLKKLLVKVAEFESLTNTNLPSGTPLFDRKGETVGIFRKMIGDKFIVSEKVGGANEGFYFRRITPTKVRVEIAVNTISIWSKKTQKENEVYEQMFQ